MIANSNSMTLWESPQREPVVARVAIAGDFLPAGELTIPDGTSWRELASSLAAHFDGVDASCVNLECVLDSEGLLARPLAGVGANVSANSKTLDYLAALRAQAIGVANNHSYDFGSTGVDRTRSVISHRGMVPLGAGRTLNDMPEVHVWQGPGDIRVGFWAAAKACADLATRRVLGVEPATVDRAQRALAEMKNRGARLCIALLHAGTMRTNRPDPEDVELIDCVASSGFHVVAASHSHRASGYRSIVTRTEVPSFCFYGLGSFVSGYISSPLEREGLIVVAGLNTRGDLANIEVRPVLLGASGFGQIPSAQMSSTIFERFRQLSVEIADGSFERLFYGDVSKHLVQFYLRDARTAFRQSGVRGLARKAGRIRMRHVRRLVRKVTG
jgi:hypothetical protein